MNILQISPQVPYPPADGGKLSIFGLLKALNKNGHNIHFVCYRKHAEYQKSYNELSKYSVPHILDEQTDNSLAGAAINLLSPVPYNISKYRRVSIKSKVKQIVENESIDVVVIHNTHMAWIIDHIKEIRDIPVVLRLENIEMMIMKRYFEQQKNPAAKFFGWLQYLKFLRYEPAVCQKADMCAAITPVDAAALKKMNPKINITAVPCGVDEDLLELPEKKKIAGSLFHIGPINWLPNKDSVHWLIESIMPKLLAHNKEFKLYIYGGGTDKIELNDNVKNNVILKGYVKDIWREISDKALGVIPLRIGSGMRIKIIELLAQGHNIISTGIGSEGINIQPGVHYLRADTELEFVNKIAAFFNDKFDNEEMSRNAKQLMKDEYVWSAVVKQFEKIFDDLENR